MEEIVIYPTHHLLHLFSLDSTTFTSLKFFFYGVRSTRRKNQVDIRKFPNLYEVIYTKYKLSVSKLYTKSSTMDEINVLCVWIQVLAIQNHFWNTKRNVQICLNDFM